MDWLNTLNEQVLWGPPMLFLLIGVGVYLTVRTGFVQFTRFGRMCRETVGKILHRGPRGEGDITPFQAMTVAMGGTVGVGNIAGVATAIAAGGPGAVFWMLFSGLIGMGTKFAEVCLGLHYRRREPGGPMVGGPMMYITRGLGPRWKPMALAFSLFGATAALGIGNMVQANAVADGAHELLGIGHWLTGLVLIVAVGLVTVGGIQRIAHVAMVFVPFMCGLYMLAALVVILVHLPQLPGVFLLIVERAFTPEAGIGGAAGISVRSAIRYGMARGVFSNEAGLGSAPIAHSTAMTDHPARQGLWGIFEVFVDTIVICAMTAFVILLTGARESGLSGAKLTMNAFGRFYGVQLGGGLVVFSMILTAYDTNLAWCFYGETCAAFLLGRGRIVRMAYRLAWLPFVLLGAVWKNDFVWALADALNGLMAIPNLIALLALGGVVVALSRGFLRGEPYQPPAD